MRTLTRLSLLLLVPLVAGAVELADACVTVIADLHGTVVVANAASAKPEDRWPVQLLQCLAARKVLMLESSSQATLFFPASSAVMELRGPGKFEITADAARPLGDSPAPSRALLNAAFREIQLDRSNLAPAGVRMRDPRRPEGPVPLEPRGIVLSAAALVFRWQAMNPNRPYRFQLAKDADEVLYETLTDASEVALPASVVLSPGTRLAWQVEDAAAPGQGRRRWQEFVVATPEVRSLAAEIDRDLPSPTAAERNLRDMLLMQRMEPTTSQH